MPSTLKNPPPWATLLYEALLQVSLASIPIAATLLHPALGMAAAIATIAWLNHIHNRATPLD